MGSQKFTSRQASTPRVATLRVTPKLTSSSGAVLSMTPRPPGVSGTTPRTLAIPYAANSSAGFTKLPNAARKAQSDAASSSQFSDAHSSDALSTRRSRPRSLIDVLIRRNRLSSWSPSVPGILRPTACTIRLARPSPRVSPNASAATRAIATAPTPATDT